MASGRWSLARMLGRPHVASGQGASAAGWTRLTRGAAVAAAVALMAGTLAGQEPPVERERECVCSPGARAFVWSGPGDFRFDFRRGRLGISLDAQQDDEHDAVGARVSSVVPGGPADEAGLRAGDVITDIDGRNLLEPLDDADEEQDLDLDRSVPVQRLIALARALEPGASVEVRYRREGETFTATLEAGEGFAFGVPGVIDIPPVQFRGWMDDEARARLEERLDEARRRSEEAMSLYFESPDPEDIRIRIPRIAQIGTFADPRVVTFDDPCENLPGAWRGREDACAAGLTLAPMNPDLGEYFGASEGVLVLHVGEESSLGLSAGDVILAIGDREVTSPSHAGRILRSYEEGETLSFRVVRQGQTRTVSGTMN